jgi:hypothetical protein
MGLTPKEPSPLPDRGQSAAQWRAYGRRESPHAPEESKKWSSFRQRDKINHDDTRENYDPSSSYPSYRSTNDHDRHRWSGTADGGTDGEDGDGDEEGQFAPVDACERSCPWNEGGGGQRVLSHVLESVRNSER